MAYVPPFLRRKKEAAADVADKNPSAHRSYPKPEDLPKDADIHDYYWPSEEPRPGDASRCNPAPSTLNASASSPDKLQYIMLFKDANPRWLKEKVIFVKTSLHLLPYPSQQGDEHGKKEILKLNDGPPGADSINGKASDMANNESPDSMLEPAILLPDDKQVENGQHSAKGECAREMQELKSSPASAIGNNETPVGNAASEKADELRPESDASSQASVSFTTTKAEQASNRATEPIAVFEQKFNRSTGGFKFIGYHSIERLQFLEPNSEDLVRMLEEKFTIKDRYGKIKQKQRDASAWKSSLSKQWAVVKLRYNREANNIKLKPNVKVSEGAERKHHKVDRQIGDKSGLQKTVNDLLKEMRLEPTESSAEATTTHAKGDSALTTSRPSHPPAGFGRNAWSVAAIAKSDAQLARAREERLKGSPSQTPTYKETYRQTCVMKPGTKETITASDAVDMDDGLADNAPKADGLSRTSQTSTTAKIHKDIESSSDNT